MPRVLLLLPSSTYRTHDFLEAAAAIGAEVVVGSDHRPALLEERALRIDLARPEAAAAAIAAYASERPLDAVVAVDDQATQAAAAAAAVLGLRHNAPQAVAASRDKARTRELLSAAGLLSPRFATFDTSADPEPIGETIAYPCVVKPIDLSGSRGVIRADDPPSFAVAFSRVAAIVRSPELCPPDGEPQRILVEDFISGREVALEGLLRGGGLEVLAIFDKPDPLEGPFFEETLYVTPSRLPPHERDAVVAAVRGATAALGLSEGPIHAEARLNARGVWVLEVAARSIGGLCSRTLRFGLGVTLEELILRHAVGLPIASLERERAASGVLMLPIRRAGKLREVRGRERAAAVPGIAGVTITIPPGGQLVPLPEGDRYLGFVFARAGTPGEVEGALRAAQACLEVVVEGTAGS